MVAQYFKIMKKKIQVVSILVKPVSQYIVSVSSQQEAVNFSNGRNAGIEPDPIPAFGSVNAH